MNDADEIYSHVKDYLDANLKLSMTPVSKTRPCQIDLELEGESIATLYIEPEDIKYE